MEFATFHLEVRGMLYIRFIQDKWLHTQYLSGGIMYGYSLKSKKKKKYCKQTLKI